MTMQIWVSFIVLVAAAFIIIKTVKKKEQRYDVFVVSDNQLKVQSILPGNYDLDKISEVVFWKINLKLNFLGVMRITMKDGSKSRPFLFDSSYYLKQVQFNNSKTNIDITTRMLTEELNSYGIKTTIRD